MVNKKLTYQEVAETMSGLVKDVNVISEKVSGILDRVNELQEPSNVKEQAVLELLMGTSEIVVGSLENILKVCEMYETSKYIVRKIKSDGYEKHEFE
jgi:uncharacterized protein YoxC